MNPTTICVPQQPATGTAYQIRVGQRLTDFFAIDVTVQRVASGGMGVVAFGPNQVWKGNMVALKTIQPALLAQSPAMRERFIREALTWVGLRSHANVLRAIAVTEMDGVPFLVLDYAEHGSVRDLLRQSQPHLSLSAALQIAQHIAAGLVALHTPDPQKLRPDPIIHRDLKPDNLLIQQMGSGQYIQITDFGLVKAVQEAGVDLVTLSSTASEAYETQTYRTQRGVALGTPAYMPPEQWEDATAVHTPADLYAFGQIISELITGRLGIVPANSRDMGAWNQAHLHQSPQPLTTLTPEVPARLEMLYQSLLAKDPAQRPTAAQTLQELQQVVSEIGAIPYSPPELAPLTPEREANDWQRWGISYARFRMFDDALIRIERAIALTPNNPDALIAQANILAELGKTDEALAAYTHALTVIPENDRGRRRAIANQTGNLLSKIGKYAEAEAAYAQALAIMPEAADTLSNRANNLGYWAQAEANSRHIAEARQHVRQGIAYAEHALKLAPNDQITLRVLRLLHQLRDLLGGA